MLVCYVSIGDHPGQHREAPSQKNNTQKEDIKALSREVHSAGSLSPSGAKARSLGT